MGWEIETIFARAVLHDSAKGALRMGWKSGRADGGSLDLVVVGVSGV